MIFDLLTLTSVTIRVYKTSSATHYRSCVCQPGKQYRISRYQVVLELKHSWRRIYSCKLQLLTISWLLFCNSILISQVLVSLYYDCFLFFVHEIFMLNERVVSLRRSLRIDILNSIPLGESLADIFTVSSSHTRHCKQKLCRRELSESSSDEISL